MAHGFQCLGHSNWTICSHLSQFCSPNFPTFSLLYWGPILITPERRRLKMGKSISPNLSVPQVFQCLEHSNWTICTLLSQFCSQNFPTFSLLYWGPILITPERGRLKMGKWVSPNLGGTGFSVPGAFKLDHLQPLKPILFS